MPTSALPQSFNRYAYVQNDPVNFVDPSGLNMEAGGGFCVTRTTYTRTDNMATLHVETTCYFTGGGGGIGGGISPIGGGGGAPIGGGGGGGGGGTQPPQTGQQGQQGGPCDQTIANIFGGPSAIAAGSGFEPRGFPQSDAWRNGQDRSRPGGPLPNQLGHLNGYSAHIYGSSPGTSDTTLYVPSGFTRHTAPSGRDAVALFYYPDQNVTLAVYHVRNFGIRPGTTNAEGSIRIGMSGGLGGNKPPDYRHSHLEVHRGWGLPKKLEDRNATRLNFRDFFCP